MREVPMREVEFVGEQEVRTPPHADQVENALQSELEMLMQRQTALAEERIKALETQMQQLHNNLRTTRERARISLTAFTKATVVLRQETERVTDIVKDLHKGLQHIDDTVKLASNGKH